MTRRLIAMTGPGGPMPPAAQAAAGRTGPQAGGQARCQKGREQETRPPGSARRRRYLVLGTVSLVVGLGTAAFTAGGGGETAPGPRITPSVEMYSVEHAITTGEVPFPGPTAQVGLVRTRLGRVATVRSACSP